MNQLFQQLNTRQPIGASNNNMNFLKQKYQECKMMTNPMGYINSIPGMKNILGLVQDSGGNAQQLFYKLAEQKGVDPDTILDMFK